MSTSKKIDLICIVAVIAALILTILFANGEALGIKKIQSETASEANDYFTVNDLYSRVNETDATEISLQGDSTSIKGNGAYYNAGKVSIVYAGTYLISGELSNGQIEIDCDGDDKVYLIFDNVTIYCEDSAALIVENADKVFLNLKEGSVNSLASGSSYSSKAENAGINATLFARDDLTINGTGSLKVNASYYHGIVAKDKLKLVDATLDVEAKQDAIHVNDKANIKAANLTLSAGDDGITVKNDDKEGSFYMESGSINIKESYEGIEAVDITIMDGHIDVVSSDDGFNACTTYPNSGIKIYGGNINIINSGGRDADGLDSNGSIFIYGGNIFISVPSDSSSTAIDYGSEVSGICKIDGGRVIACGSSSMLEGVDSSSAQCTLIHGFTESIQGGQTLTIKASDGSDIVNDLVVKNTYNSIVVSTPELKADGSYTITAGSSSEEVTMTGAITSDVTGGRGGMGGFSKGNKGQMPEMTQPSDGSQMPQMTRPTDGNQMPEMTQPADSSQGTEGTQMMKGNRRGQMTTDGQAPDMTKEVTNDKMAGNFGDRNANNDSNKNTSQDMTQIWILIGVSVLLLLLGLLVAIKYKEKY